MIRRVQRWAAETVLCPQNSNIANKKMVLQVASKNLQPDCPVRYLCGIRDARKQDFPSVLFGKRKQYICDLFRINRILLGLIMGSPWFTVYLMYGEAII